MNKPPESEEDIQALLKKAFEPPTEGAEAFKFDVSLDGVNLTDHTQEERLVQNDAERDGVLVPELPAIEPSEDTSTFDKDPVDDVKATLNAAFAKDYDFASVVVEQDERERFYRCGLHDEAMWFDIDLPKFGMVIKVVIPPVSHSEAAIAALNAWGEAGEIGGNSMQYLHGFQLLNVWLMVRAVNDKATEWYEAALEDAGGKLTHRALRKLLSNTDTVEPVREVNDVRWQAMSLAVRIADYKNKICLDALRSRVVFTTAGSA